jgi:hypothetical protein
MSKAHTTLDDFATTDDAADAAESDVSDAGERPESPPDWTPQNKASHSGAERLRCECGAAIVQWSSPSRARTLVRAFGDESEGTVPGCPDCVSWRCDDSQRRESIAHAVREMDRESSIERQDPRELAIREVRER